MDVLTWRSWGPLLVGIVAALSVVFDLDADPVLAAGFLVGLAAVILP